MFAWLFGAVALALVFAPPRLRNIGLVVVGALFLVFLATVLSNRRPVPSVAAITPHLSQPSADSRRFDFDQYQRDKQDRADPAAKSRIPVSAVRFDQVRAIAGIDSGTLQSVHARLYNDSSQFTLTDYAYYLVVKDCLPASNLQTGAGCTAVYDQRDAASLIVPPSQARDVAIAIPNNGGSFTAPFKLLGTPRIELSATDTRAYQP